MWRTLRKFGWGYCDLPTMIWNVKVMLRMVCLDIEGGTKSIPKVFYFFNIVASMMYLFNYHVSMAYFVFVGCRETGNYVDGIMVLSISLASLIGVNKFIYMHKHLNKVQSLVADYLAYDRVPLAPSTAGFMAAIMRSVKTRAIVFWAVTMGNAIAFNLQPLVDLAIPTRLDLYDKHVVYGLKGLLRISNYPVAVINIFICTTYICHITISIAGLLILTTGYSEGRLLALSRELRDLWTDAQINCGENDNSNDNLNKDTKLNEYINHRLQLIVMSHAINIDLIKKIDDIFRNAIAVEFTLLTSSLINDLLGGLENTFIIMPYSILQVVMDCYMGQKLVDASRVFEDAVYDCQWENFDHRNMKTVLLMLRMSQKSLALSAGGVTTLGFGCIMAVYKTVYSVYTALQSTME